MENSNGAGLMEEERASWPEGEEESREGVRTGGDRVKVHLNVLVDPGRRPATSGNVSTGGIMIFTDRPLEPGTPVSLAVATQDGLQLAEGIVRWASRGCGRDEGTFRRCMGIEFTWMTLGLGELLKNPLE